jgi:glycosyltransferase involved in cell wall biosynthesis
VNVAVVHHLPSGGAVRVMAEWLARTDAEQLTLYTRDTRVHSFAGLPKRVQVIERPLRQGGGAFDEIARVAYSPHDGARLAAEIDAAGHDAVFCFASVMTQAIDVLPFLHTPSLFYAPEPLRSAYEPPELVQLAPGWRGALMRRGLHPIEIRRRALDRRYLRAAPHIVTHSEFTRQTLADIYGVEAEVVLLGVDAGVFSPGDQPREGYVLSVGALHPLKGHDQVIAALATLPRPRPPLVIVGDRGESAAALSALADASGVELELRSRLELPEVVETYRRAGVVACAQIREPFGLVPLEAMACETPVVAVAEGGFRETVSDGETGLLSRRDPHALGAAVKRVLGDETLAQRLGSTGRETVVHDWTWERTSAAFDRILHRIAGR